MIDMSMECIRSAIDRACRDGKNYATINTRTQHRNGVSERWLMQMNEGDLIAENIRIVRRNRQS